MKVLSHFFYYEEKVRIVVSEIECNVEYNYVQGVVVGNNFYTKEAFQDVVDKINERLKKDHLGRERILMLITNAQKTLYRVKSDYRGINNINNEGTLNRLDGVKQNNKIDINISDGILQDWENIEEELFGAVNTTAFLAGYYNDESKEGTKAGGLIYESEAKLYGRNISRSGNITKRVRERIKAIQQGESLNNVNILFGDHYSNYLKQAISTINSNSAYRTQIYKWMGQHGFYPPKKGSVSRQTMTYAQAVYGIDRGKSKEGKGNIYEAYIGHLVNYHKQMISLKDISNFKKPQKDVFNENGTGELQWNNFLDMLNFANGTDKWFQGGDILTISGGKNGIYQISMNIQVKSQRDAWMDDNMKINIRDLFAVYDQLYYQIASLGNNGEIDANYLYSALSIESLQVELSKKIDETVNSLIGTQK